MRPPSKVNLLECLLYLALFSRMSVEAGLNTHEARVEDLDPVPVAQPDLAVHLHHAPDGVVRLT